MEDRIGNKIGYLVSTIIDLVLIYVVNNLVSWNWSFIKSSFADVSLIITLSLVVSVITNIILLIYDKGVIKPVAQVFMNVFSLISTFYVVRVFPFDFTQIISITWINSFAKICMWAVMLALVIGTITEFARIFKVDVKCEELSKGGKKKKNKKVK